jgi:hypothetical protein
MNVAFRLEITREEAIFSAIAGAKASVAGGAMANLEVVLFALSAVLNGEVKRWRGSRLLEGQDFDQRGSRNGDSSLPSTSVPPDRGENRVLPPFFLLENRRHQSL